MTTDTAPRTRRTRSDIGKRRGPRPGVQAKRRVEIMLRPDNLEWARSQVQAGYYPSVSAYIDYLLGMAECASRII